ncbi:hypothetical protein IMZ48_06030, partial [Candidatus Bathyarchaeota archaeon]|nr:hypothetical protein [Candidatus Bathyarchaeota archaeon]
MIKQPPFHFTPLLPAEMGAEPQLQAAQDGAETGAAGGPAREKDVAIAMVGEEKNEIDPAVTARAVRKTDWFLMPAMIVGCAYFPIPLPLPTPDTHQTVSS